MLIGASKDRNGSSDESEEDDPNRMGDVDLQNFIAFDYDSDEETKE